VKSLPELSDATFRRISAIMYDTVGLSFGDNKRSLISSRLAGRIQRLGLPDFETYAELLDQPDEAIEFQMAVDLLTTNETYFFREPKHFELLAQEVSAARSRAPLAVWSAASSFGDEAYSIAMLLSDLQQIGKVAPDWTILGTDISHRVLQAAGEAVYPEDRLRHVEPERLKRYCLRGEGANEGQVMVNDAVRRHVKFGQLNLTRDFDGIGPFDVVFLRNVLIYFDGPTKIEVVDRVLRTLKPGGLFFMGTAEGRVNCATPLKSLAPGAFRKAS
jgi:chemotaxis protein methyltransferase CheR